MYSVKDEVVKAQPNGGLRLFTRTQLRELLNQSHRTFRQIERESLPAPIYVSPGKPCWSLADIQAWLDSRKGGTKC